MCNTNSTDTLHRWEKAGLGQAPYTFIGASKNVIRYDDGSTQPGGTCAYCSTGIMHEFRFRSADGKTFVVGSTCVHKHDAAGLTNAKKYSMELARLRSESKQERERAKVIALIAEHETALAATPHIYRETRDGKMLTMLDFCRKAVDSPALSFCHHWLTQSTDSPVWKAKFKK